MANESANSARVAQNARFKTAFSNVAVATEGLIKAPRQFLDPLYELFEQRAEQRRKSRDRAVERAQGRRKRREASPERGKQKALPVASEGRRPREVEVSRKPELKLVISGENVGEKAVQKPKKMDIATRLDVSDAGLRKVLNSGIRGLGSAKELVASDGEEAYFLFAADPQFARIVKENAGALALLGGRLGAFVDSVSVSGVAYLVTRKAGAEAIELGRLQPSERRQVAESVMGALAGLHEKGVTLGRFRADRIYADGEGVFFPDIRKLAFLAKGESPVPEMLFVLAELVNSGAIAEHETGTYADAYLSNSRLSELCQEYFRDPHNHRRMTSEEYESVRHEGYAPKNEARRTEEELRALIEKSVKRYRTAVYFVNSGVA